MEKHEEEKVEEDPFYPMNSSFILQDDPYLHSHSDVEDLASQVRLTIHEGWSDQSRNSALTFSFNGVPLVDSAAQITPPDLIIVKPSPKKMSTHQDSLQTRC